MTVGNLLGPRCGELVALAPFATQGSNGRRGHRRHRDAGALHRYFITGERRLNIFQHEFPDHNACIVCRCVALNGAEPYGVLHEADGVIQIVCEADVHAAEDYLAIGLIHAVNFVPEALKRRFLRGGNYFLFESGEWNEYRNVDGLSGH